MLNDNFFKKNVKFVGLDGLACMVLKKTRACEPISLGPCMDFFFLFVSYDNLSSIFFFVFFLVSDRSSLAACNKSLVRVLLRIQPPI